MSFFTSDAEGDDHAVISCRSHAGPSGRRLYSAYSEHLMVTTRRGPYELTGLLDGGTGEGYRTRDARLRCEAPPPRNSDEVAHG